jgi:hypothetical protein
MNLNQRSWRQITFDIVLVASGVCIFWIPYLFCWFGVSSLTAFFSLVFFPVGLYVAKRGMEGVLKDGIHMAAGTVVLLNVVGIVAFLVSASDTWIEPELADVAGASGGSGIVGGLTALPIFLGFGLLDLLWVLFVCLVCPRKEIWRIGWAFLSLAVTWAVALYFDNSRHGS